MEKVAIIQCCKTKMKPASSSLFQYNPLIRARKLYASPLFRMYLEYCELVYNKVLIISEGPPALITPDDKIEYYDDTFDGKTDEQIDQWARKVSKRLEKHVNKEDKIFFYCPSYVYEKVTPYIENEYVAPHDGKKIGERLQWLRKEIDGIKLK